MTNRTTWTACRAIGLSTLLGAALTTVGCTKTEAESADKIDQKYGLTGAFEGEVPTSEGPIRGTLVPVTLADGRKAQLFVPQHARNETHGVYLRDDQGLHPVRVKDGATRAQVSSAPAVVASEPEPSHEHKRSWEKDALIIGGSAGAGTAIGAIAGGKKGAAIGAAAGGVGGLIYDLTTQHKN